ncbi:hypothetical protein LTR10_009545 [Elasticomyces elasticus]|nr:hypothetical protein LTR10_009545 [Elasticomyces elasticus]KAK4971360.1 hypothetical protein LTR42_007087 [Elasticomyces elasticus]
MESLLSVSFACLSSRDTSRIRKGLRQIEGLLAQICLSNNRLSPHKRKTSVINDADKRECKQLRELRKDAAYREFFRLQEGFKWNVASRLIATVERLMGMQSASQSDILIFSTLDLLQGVLLLHPPSRTLFNREDYMNLLLDLLDSSNPPKIQSQALLVLVTALLDCPANTRTFEAIDGLLTVTSLFKSRNTTQEVKMRTLEFLYFYLMPESPPTSSSSLPSTQANLQRSPSKLQIMAGHARTHSGDDGDRMDVDEDDLVRETKTTEDKQKLLGKHLNNVAELVRDLRENAVFAATAAAG